jgi:serine protease Do
MTMKKVKIVELIERLLAWLAIGAILIAVACSPAATSGPTSKVANATAYQALIGQMDFVAAVGAVLPSMVVIEVTYAPSASGRGQSGAAGGAGTGWVINANGLIVTNDHVVANAKTITVTLADNRQFTAASVQTDPQNDLAVIKINAQNLPVVTPGDSSSLRVAQPLVAIGNSLDMGVRVTGGLVSRLGTSATYSITNQTSVTLDNLIETDAVINPGNSGGVLINAAGEVVGIVNAGLSGPNTDTIGFGYAIPINDALPVIKKLMAQIPS